MKLLELFSSMGGLAYGLELAGAKHGCFIEFNKHACESLRRNFYLKLSMKSMSETSIFLL
jgi:DNA (cytosine-5)-methyltransferase 1